MSERARICVTESATAPVRLKRGSTETSLALRIALGLHHEAEAHRMVLGRIAAHGQVHVRIAGYRSSR